MGVYAYVTVHVDAGVCVAVNVYVYVGGGV